MICTGTESHTARQLFCFQKFFHSHIKSTATSCATMSQGPRGLGQGARARSLTHHAPAMILLGESRGLKAAPVPRLIVYHLSQSTYTFIASTSFSLLCAGLVSLALHGIEAVASPACKSEFCDVVGMRPTFRDDLQMIGISESGTNNGWGRAHRYRQFVTPSLCLCFSS